LAGILGPYVNTKEKGKHGISEFEKQLRVREIQSS